MGCGAQALQKRTLARVAFVDGTIYRLARTSDEAAQQERRRLGSHVWRMRTGKDGLFDVNVGPSLYAASQGQPVKVWGYFANGVGRGPVAVIPRRVARRGVPCAPPRGSIVSRVAQASDVGTSPTSFFYSDTL